MRTGLVAALAPGEGHKEAAALLGLFDRLIQALSCGQVGALVDKGQTGQTALQQGLGLRVETAAGDDGPRVDQ